MRLLSRVVKSARYRLGSKLDRMQSAPSRRAVERIVRRFHRLYYGQRERTWTNTFFLGVPLAKCALDLWIYQEIIYEVRPDVIVETGTAHGGSALYLATLCDIVGNGRVITIDLVARDGLPQHGRITYLTSSSVAEAAVESVRRMIRPGERVLVILDSDHARAHVLEEMRLYGEMVTPGSYLIVEDSNINGHPVHRTHGAGPREAIADFLKTTTAFEVDSSREKFFMTFNPGGYLRKRGTTSRL